MRGWLLVVMAGCGGEPGHGELMQAATQCPPQTVEGVDVYQGDGTIDWAMVKASGRVFAFTKASQGDYNMQSNFDANWSNTAANGLSRGPYHYFDATVDGVAQAQWFLAQIQQAGGFQPGDLPPVLDIECPVSTTQASASNMCLGNGKSGWAPTATVIQRAWDFLDTVEAATGRKPIIYSYPSWFATFGFTDPKLADYPLWIASINSNTCATVPAPWTAATFWQYSFQAHVPGIGGGTVNVDADRFMGSEAELKTFAAGDVKLDAGVDAGPDLSSTPDLATVDAALDASAMRMGSDVEGCSCQVGGRGGGFGWWILILALGGAVFRRRPTERLQARHAGNAARSIPGIIA